MPTVALYQFTTKTVANIRDDILRSIYNGLVAGGVSNPNVSKGSDYWVLATAVAIEIAVSQSNTTLRADAAMPDTAGGADLDRILANYGLSRRSPIGSTGLITITCSIANTLIPTGTQLTDSANLRYQVSAGGYFSSGQQVPVAAIDTGSGTNHANGDVLKWVSTPAFCQSSVTVGTTGGADGLTGGNDGEANDDETPRARLIQRLQGVAAAGNSGFVILSALQSSPYVQSGYCYPGLYGAGTLAFAVAGAPQTSGVFSSTSKNRDINTTIVAQAIFPYVVAAMPEHAFVQGSTVTNYPTDVALLLNLPSAPTASPPGPGGGWVDGTPWPASSSGLPVTVNSVTSPTVINVSAATAPSLGASVAFFSPLTWTLYTAHVTGITGSAFSYTITLDSPFVGIANGNYVFPQSVNQQAYLSAMLAGFASMGPGELTSSATFLARAYRHPPPQASWPYSLTAAQLRLVTNSGPEVLSAAYLYTSILTPPVASAITITAATGAGVTIQITAPSHGLATGAFVGVQGGVGNTAMNGNWIATVIDGNTLSLNGSVGNGTYAASTAALLRPPNILVPRNIGIYAA
jgi:uncharacterized phage protein gp47/JayE